MPLAVTKSRLTIAFQMRPGNSQATTFMNIFPNVEMKTSSKQIGTRPDGTPQLEMGETKREWEVDQRDIR